MALPKKENNFFHVTCLLSTLVDSFALSSRRAPIGVCTYNGRGCVSPQMERGCPSGQIDSVRSNETASHYEYRYYMAKERIFVPFNFHTTQNMMHETWDTGKCVGHYFCVFSVSTLHQTEQGGGICFIHGRMSRRRKVRIFHHRSR